MFTCEGCGLCRVLAPHRARFGEHPSVVLRTFDEVEHPNAWSTADVPGSPFAVALDADGTVLAKGTFNSGAQLESVLAAAERRRRSGTRARILTDGWPCELAARLPAEVGAAVMGVAGVTTVGSLSPPARPRRTTSAATSTRLTRARTRRGCRGSTAQGFPIRAETPGPWMTSAATSTSSATPVDEDGHLLTDADGARLPRTRTRVCHATADVYGFTPYVDGAWYRCCGGHVRKLVDCCGTMRRRVNGDRALTGYCYRDRKVFCVMYFQTKIKC